MHAERHGQKKKKFNFLNLLLHNLGFISELTQIVNINDIPCIHAFAICCLHLTRNLVRTSHIK